MNFDVTKCVNYISFNTSKKISEAFGRWLQKYNVTRIQWVALFFLHTRGHMSQRELSQMMEITDSSAMRLIERLERDRLVRRTRSESDRRVIILELTKEGTALIERLLPVGEEFSKTLTAGISEEDMSTFMRVQQKLFDNVMNDKRSLK